MDYPTEINPFLIAQLSRADDQTRKFLNLLNGIRNPSNPTDDERMQITSAYVSMSQPWLQVTQLFNQFLSDIGATADTSTRSRTASSPIFTKSQNSSTNDSPFRLNTTPLSVSEQKTFLEKLVLIIKKFSVVELNGTKVLQAFIEASDLTIPLSGVYRALCFDNNSEIRDPCNESVNNNNVCWTQSFTRPEQHAYISNIALACFLLTQRLYNLYVRVQYTAFDSDVEMRIKELKEADRALMSSGGGLTDLPDRQTIKDDFAFDFKEPLGVTDANSLGVVGLNNLIPQLGNNKNLGGYLIALLRFSEYFTENETGSPRYVLFRKRFIQYALNVITKYNSIMFKFISSVDQATLDKRVEAFNAQLAEGGVEGGLIDYVADKLNRVETLIDENLKTYGTTTGVVAGGAALKLLNPQILISAGALAYTAQMEDQIEELTEEAKALCEKMEILMLLNKQSAYGYSAIKPFSEFAPPIETLFAPVSNFSQAKDKTYETCFATDNPFWCKVTTYTASAAVLGLAFWGLRKLVKSNI